MYKMSWLCVPGMDKVIDGIMIYSRCYWLWENGTDETDIFHRLRWLEFPNHSTQDTHRGICTIVGHSVRTETKLQIKSHRKNFADSKFNHQVGKGCKWRTTNNRKSYKDITEYRICIIDEIACNIQEYFSKVVFFFFFRFTTNWIRSIAIHDDEANHSVVRDVSFLKKFKI